MPNCHCSICSLPMYADKPIPHFNFCSRDCKRMNETKRRRDFEMPSLRADNGFVRKGKPPVALEMQPWSAKRNY